jgi:hypothetical protein
VSDVIIGRRRFDPSTVALVVALAIGLPLLLWLGRGMTFFSDEWAFIQTRSLGDPATWLTPHNEHWSTLPVIAYRVLVDTVGLWTYVPYLAVVIALHALVVTLTFVAIRRSSGPLAAVAAAILLLLYGSGFENLYWGFQTGFVGATAAGIAALLALDRHDDRGRWGVAILLLIGLATAGIALAFAVAVTVESLVARRLRSMLVPLAIPALVYVAWFVAFGRFGIRTGTAVSTSAFTDVPSAIITGFSNAAGAITGVGPNLGIVSAVAIGVWAAVRLWRDRTLPARFVGCIAGIAALYGLIGLTRSHDFTGIIGYTRYTYVSGILLLIAVGSLAGRIRLPEAPNRRLLVMVPLGGLLAAALVFNARLLLDGRDLFLLRAARTRALITVAMERPLPATTDPNRSLVLVPSPAVLETLLARYGSPLSDVLVPWAVEPIPADLLATARKALAEGIEVPH